MTLDVLEIILSLLTMSLRLHCSSYMSELPAKDQHKFDSVSNKATLFSSQPFGGKNTPAVRTTMHSRRRASCTPKQCVCFLMSVKNAQKLQSDALLLVNIRHF